MDRLFGFDRVSRHDDNVELLTTVYDNVQLSVLRSILDGEGIAYLIKERASGSSVKVITGFSMYGTDVFVHKDRLEEAKELLAAMSDPNAEFVDPVPEDDGENETK